MAQDTEFVALRTVIEVLQDLDPAARRRIFDAAATFLQIGAEGVGATSVPVRGALPTPPPSERHSYPAFSEDTAMSVKEFMLQKQPRSDVERIAVLAFYLTHYLSTPHFKTLDLSKLNTEAAQPKFSNAANSVSNAVKTRYLVPSTKGSKQISAAGEQFVRALPDRDAARQAMATSRPRKRTKRAAVKKTAGG